MQLAHAHERLEFAPPPQRGMLRALGLAIVAHAVLLAGLSLSVQWKTEAPVVAVEAELWSAIPQEAAPKLETPPPEPEPEPQPVAKPDPTPAPPMPDPAIVLEQEKKRKLAEEQARQQQFLLQQKQEAEKKRLQKAEQERLEKEKKAAEDKRQAELDKRKEAQKKQEDAKKLEAQRQENVRRMMGLAGGTGAPTSTGAAQKSAGPSASYAGRIVARVRPNIVFTEDVAGNPAAVVRVRTAPDGTIVGRQLITPSGVKAWDEAVLRAIDRTETLPRDVDGRVPPTIDIDFRPKG